MARPLMLLLVLVECLAAATSLHAGDPMLLAGFAPNTVQDGDMTGHVNVMSGALNLQQTFGPTFRVNAALSFSLTGNYSSSNRRWDVFPNCTAPPPSAAS